MATHPIRTGLPCAQSFARTPRPCGHCGQEFTPRRPGGRQRLGLASWGRYCSNSCSTTASTKARAKPSPPPPKDRQCAICAGLFRPKAAAHIVCSDACRRVRKRDASLASSLRRDQRDRSVRRCRCCGETFAPTYGNKRRLFCSRSCLKSLNHQRADHGKSHRKRARRAGVAYETVNRVQVFERDGWRCQVCGCSTPRAWIGSQHPQAPELDHRVPIAMGGGHTWANVQTACRRCNAAKGGWRVVGQLPLFARAA